MKYSTNYNMNKPELSEQYRLDHWNDNTDIIDTELKRNADNIATVKSALQNITDSTFKTALLNFCYPVGSLYWSSKSDNPSTLFGGTWVQIKDRFIWAKGDSDAVNAIGGSKTVTLTANNLPSHSHSMNHNHTGSVSGNVGTTNTNHTHNYSFVHSHNFHAFLVDEVYNTSNHKTGKYIVGRTNFPNIKLQFSATTYNSRIADTLEGIDGKYAEHLEIADTTISGTTSLSNGENSSISHSHTWNGSITIDTKTANTGSVGGGTAHENMPPYIVKFCWERTA